nr:hypothetical protein [Bacteroidota bacterium]
MRFCIYIILFTLTQIIYGQGGFKRNFKLPYSLNNTTKNVFETTPGNYITCGIVVDTLNSFQTNRLAIMGLNSQGQLQWVKKYGNHKFEYLDNSLITKWFYKKDNFIYHAGCVRDSNNVQLGVLIKFDFNGDTIWQKKYYDSTNIDVIPQMVCGSVDGGFLIAGFSQNWNNHTNPVLLIKTDVNGNELWRKKISKAIPNVHDAKVILQDSISKKIVLAGYQYIGTATAYSGYPSVLILDSLGNKLSQHGYTGQGLFTNLIQTKDKKIIAIGAVGQPEIFGALNSFKSIAVKFDVNNPTSPIWNYEFDKTAVTNFFTGITELNNEDLLITGILDTMQQNNLATNCLQRIIRINKNGNLLSTKYFDYSPNHLVDNNQTILSLNKTSDNGYISAFQVFNTSPSPFFVVKYDSTFCDSSVFYCQTVGLEELKSNNYKLNIYPNPTSDILNIELDDLFAVETATIKI